MGSLTHVDNAYRAPLQGFGTFQADTTLYPPGTAKSALLTALEVGYRHIDTAFGYGSGEIEKEVGEAIRESRIPRGELYIVTKLHNTFHAPEDVEAGIDLSLTNLGLEYVDLYLLHNPFAYAKGPKFSTLRRADGSGKPVIDLPLSKRYPETWTAMAALVRAGKARSIGLSNFNMLKMRRIIATTGIIPAANQIELNPYFPQFKLVEFCKRNDIQVIAHCPLGGALAPTVANRKGHGPLEDVQIRAIAKAHGKTPAQVILAWLTGRGISVVPKSANPERIWSNYEMLFRLSPQEDAQIASLVGRNGEHGVRNMVNDHHVGFDVFDEIFDQPRDSDGPVCALSELCTSHGPRSGLWCSDKP